MPKGIVKWFDRDIRTGVIRTDAGANVLFFDSVLQESDPRLIREGTRVSLDILISQSELTAVNVRPLNCRKDKTDCLTHKTL